MTSPPEDIELDVVLGPRTSETFFTCESGKMCMTIHNIVLSNIPIDASQADYYCIRFPMFSRKVWEDWQHAKQAEKSMTQRWRITEIEKGVVSKLWEASLGKHNEIGCPNPLRPFPCMISRNSEGRGGGLQPSLTVHNYYSDWGNKRKGGRPINNYSDDCKDLLSRAEAENQMKHRILQVQNW